MTIRVGILMQSDVDGGAEHWVRRLATGLLPLDIESTLLGRIPRWTETNLPLHPGGLSRKWSRRAPLRTLASLPTDRRRLRDLTTAHPDLDCFHMHFKREQILASAAARQTAPVVWTEHGVFPRGRGTALLAATYRRASSTTSAIVCVSDEVAADVRQICGRRAVRVEVIENAVDREIFRPPSTDERLDARRSLGLGASDVVAVTVARLHPGKRIERAIAAASATGARLVVVGEGADEERLRRLAPPDAVFTGFLHDPRRAMWAADFGIFCGSANEGAPQAPLEMAACGIASAAFDGDVGSRLVEQLAGTVIASPSGLTPSIVAALTEQGAEARSASSGWDATEWIRRWADLYQSL